MLSPERKEEQREDIQYYSRVFSSATSEHAFYLFFKNKVMVVGLLFSLGQSVLVLLRLMNRITDQMSHPISMTLSALTFLCTVTTYIIDRGITNVEKDVEQQLNSINGIQVRYGNNNDKKLEFNQKLMRELEKTLMKDGKHEEDTFEGTGNLTKNKLSNFSTLESIYAGDVYILEYEVEAYNGDVRSCSTVVTSEDRRDIPVFLRNGDNLGVDMKHDCITVDVPRGYEVTQMSTLSRMKQADTVV
jgi:hypothetical protein